MMALPAFCDYGFLFFNTIAIMKTKITFCFFILSFITVSALHAQNPVNWTDKELMQPAELAKYISDDSNKPLVVSIGPGALIPGSVNIGMVNDKDNMEKLKNYLSSVDKNKNLVIYCGCCPFEHCPNVRPAVALLKEMKFTNYHLLNLSKNLKADWIDKGYPVQKLEH
jgi:rhodanese-related sulfurtransferase